MSLHTKSKARQQGDEENAWYISLKLFYTKNRMENLGGGEGEREDSLISLGLKIL